MATRGGRRRSNKSVTFNKETSGASLEQESVFFPQQGTEQDNKPEVEVSSSLEEENKRKEKIKKAAESIPEVFTPQQVSWVFDVYVGAICFVYSLILKTDFKAINDELKMDEDEKMTLAVPLAQVLSKHAPSEWAGMSAEIQLITTMGIWTVSSFGRAKNIAAKEAEKKQQDNRRRNMTHPVQPVRRGEPIHADNPEPVEVPL